MTALQVLQNFIFIMCIMLQLFEEIFAGKNSIFFLEDFSEILLGFVSAREPPSDLERWTWDGTISSTILWLV